jgi:uncharacterized membrane protein YbhN (UPF0104 family)
MGKVGRFWRWLLPVLAAAALAGALYLLHRQLSRYSLADIVESVKVVPGGRIAATALFAALSYLTLTFFDYFGVRYTWRRLPWRWVALASFCSLSIGHNVGFAALSTGTIRLRFYTRMGLPVGDVARVVLFSASTVGIGLASLAAIVLLLAEVPPGLPLSPAATRPLGLACALAVVAYVVLAGTIRGALRIGQWHVTLPPWRLALLQVALGTTNFAFVAAALYHAVAAATEAGYFGVVVAYIMGTVAGLLAHVPGNLGVLEAVVLLLLTTGTIGGLILFRVVYYFIPALLGVTLLGLSELSGRRSFRVVSAAE